MSAPTDILDSLLPLLQPEGRELHLNAAIVELAEPAQLAELAANPQASADRRAATHVWFDTFEIAELGTVSGSLSSAAGHKPGTPC
jgi:hypothetical protein